MLEEAASRIFDAASSRVRQLKDTGSLPRGGNGDLEARGYEAVEVSWSESSAQLLASQETGLPPARDSRVYG